MWPDLKFAPINLWNVPYMFKERTIIDKILDEEFRYYIRMGKYCKYVYLGYKEMSEIDKQFVHGMHGRMEFNGLEIMRVEQETYLRVG